MFIGNLADIVGIEQDGRYMYISLGSGMEGRPVKFAAGQSHDHSSVSCLGLALEPLGEAEHACPSRSECISEKKRKGGPKTPAHHSLCITI